MRLPTDFVSATTGRALLQVDHYGAIASNSSSGSVPLVDVQRQLPHRVQDPNRGCDSAEDSKAMSCSV